MPVQATSRNVINVSPDPKVRRGRNVDPVESRKDGGRRQELGTIEANLFGILRLRALPSTNIHGVGRATLDVILVLGVGNPARDSRIESCVAPGVNVNGEVFTVDIGCISLNASAGAASGVKRPEEDNNLRSSDKRTFEINATGGLSLGLIPRMVTLSAEISRKNVEIGGLQD